MEEDEGTPLDLMHKPSPFTQTKVAGEQSAGGVSAPRLVQEAEFQLYGNIESLDSVKLPHSSRSTLVLCFKEAKVQHVNAG